MKKIAVISDTHGLLDHVRDVLDYEENIDLLIHLGDNIADFSAIKEEYKDIESVYIIGNHDMDWLEPKELLLDVYGARIYATHGHSYNIKVGFDDILKRAKDLKADIVLYGHSHIQKCLQKDEIIIINPGSLSEPREDNCLFSYTIIEVTKREIIVTSKWKNYESNGIGLEIGTVKLVEHNDKWHEIFETEKQHVQEILGNKVVQIEHIGSTSIPNMPAKPIIDIIVALDSIGSVEYATKKLVNDGYIYKGPIAAINDRFGFVKGVGNKRDFHLYLTTLNSEVWYDYVLDRNYIREHPEAFDEYIALKKELAEKYADDRRKYTESKFYFLEELHRKARKEYLGIEYKKKLFKDN